MNNNQRVIYHHRPNSKSIGSQKSRERYTSGKKPQLESRFDHLQHQSYREYFDEESEEQSSKNHTKNQFISEIDKQISYFQSQEENSSALMSPKASHLSQEEIIELQKATELVKDNIKDAKLYATVGNHDTYPQDKWIGQSPQDNLILQKWKKSWAPLFTDKKQTKEFGDYGHYSQLLTFKNGTMIGERPTKVISFNSNYCVAYNFYAWVQWSDPGHEIEWLENELQELEKVGGAAILLSHVPNIHQCVRNFGIRWHALMDRYQHVIRWTMAAHNHIQSWNIERSIFTKQPIMMNYIIGSTTPWGHSTKKPTFVVLDMDPDTLIPVNLNTYSFDIKHANKFNEPKWDLDYDFKEVYNLTDLSPKSFSEYASKMDTDERASQIFRNYTTRGYWTMDKFPKCDKQCRLNTMCAAISNDYDDVQQCAGYRSFDPIPHSFNVFMGDALAPLLSLFPDIWSRNWWRRKTNQSK